MVRMLSTPAGRPARVALRHYQGLSPPAAAAGGHAGGVDEVDVAIFGAGPAGLSTALALSKACPELKVHVYERARKFRPSGGCLGFGTPNIFTAFQAMGDNVEETVREAGIKRRNYMTAEMDGSGRKTRHIDSVIIAWYEMQKALLSCLPSTDMVSLNCELAKIEDDDDMAVATLANGRTVHAKLLVGADGNRSMARQFVQGNTQPIYTGAAVWRFFMPGENPFVEVSDTLALTGNNKLMSMQPVRREGSILTYCSGLSGFDEDRLAELNTTRYIQDSEEDTQALHAKLDRFATAFDGFHPEMMDYVLKNAAPESVLEHPMYSLDPRNDWVKSRVALVGDAVHVMPPNMAQGTPMAAEDAVQLASSILNHGISPAALSDYEATRKERVTPIWEASTAQAVGYYKDKSAEDDPMRGGDKYAHVIPLIHGYKAPLLQPGAGAVAV